MARRDLITFPLGSSGDQRFRYLAANGMSAGVLKTLNPANRGKDKAVKP